MTDLITRQQARTQGLKWYFTGKPCKHGHIAERQTANGSCRTCGAAGNADKCRRWYYEKGREQVIAAAVISQRVNRPRRYHSDPSYRAVHRMRSRLRKVLTGQGAAKSATTMELIGCTRDQLLAHIKAQFLPGMSWESRNEWHIDHILPCVAFDLLDPIHQRACFHYTNLQPLWGADNLRKKDKHDPAEVAAWVARFACSTD